jgi:uncharacterized membrane protein YeaQ/YmgE (transglycosylase-associated protein family)
LSSVGGGRILNPTRGGSMMPWLWFLILGLIAGWLAGVLTKGSGYGVFGDVVVGVVGSVFGGWIFGVVGLAAYGFLGSLVMALVGALAFLALVRLVKRL